LSPLLIPGNWLRRCLALALAGAGAVSASAEVIHLKDGDVIYVDSVKEGANKVEYSIGDDTYAIPKSRVQSIEAGARPQVNPPPSQAEMAAFTPDTRTAGEGPLLERIVHDGNVDRVALASVALQHDAKQTAAAFYLAGKLDYLAGKYSEARGDFETALANDPENPNVLNFYAALLIRTGNGREAVPYAERAVSVAHDSPDALAVLGYAQFAADRPKGAILSWKQSLALRPDASIQQVMARAEREMSAENSYSEREAGHFVLHFEGTQSSVVFRDQLLSTLEADYVELSRDFGSEPRSSIPVVLYTNQAFFDVTQEPSWVGALNDGKLRIPLQGLDSVTPDLARVLKHELTHSFVNQLSMGRCPQWLNEGIAQMMEPRLLVRGANLAQLFKRQQEIPLNALEGSFSSLSGPEAEVAYDESLAAAQYIQAHYGMSDLIRILERLGHGESAESALRSTIHSDYRQFQDEIGAELAHQFGQ
jgi:tetratricopeptide (TPR) repeat protein